MYVDSHCHLSFPELHGQVDNLLVEMADAGVDQALCICTTLEEFDTVRGLAERHDRLWASVGVHPDNEGILEPTIEDLVRRANHPKVVAIGETGLDYYRLGDRTIADMAWQRDRLSVHVRAAQLAGKPLVVHTRSAANDTLRLLAQEGAGNIGGVFHCFTETIEVARAALDLGFHVSFSGILSFRNAEQLRDVARFVPLERCLIETDSPYLAPVPFRGKLNRPAWVVHVASALAAAKGLAVDAVAHQTSANFRALFRIPAPPLRSMGSRLSA